jgi:hypothetical protein
MKKLLEEWDLQKSVKKIRKDHVRYFYDLGCIDFVSVKGDEPHAFFEIHCELWCENITDIVVFVSEKGDITVCDPKVKPSKNHKKSIILSCDQDMEPSEYVTLFQKKHIDSGKCINTIQKLAKKELRTPIDTDLVKTLDSCAHKISDLVHEKNREEIACTIVDCCLLIRFLEDKLNKNTLKEALDHENFNDLEKLFYSYRDIIPCDIDIPRNSAIIKILKVFGTEGVYTFKKTPVKVFSSIYEQVLSNREKTQCIPANVVEYAVNNLLGTYSDTKIKENQMKVLNFACGSGIFLVTFLEKIIEKREVHTTLSLKEKIQIAQMLYGVAQNRNSFRITVFCLYLKLIEGEPVKVAKKFFDNLCDLHIKEVDLVTNPFCDEFDIIVGDSVQIPYSHNISHNEDTPNTEKWGDVRCSFLLHVKKWMHPQTMCGIIAPLHYFTLKKYKKFREHFLQTYGLQSFANFSKIMPHDMCYLYFGTASESIKFCTPEPHYFYSMTGIITEDNKVIAHSAILKESDHLWPVFAQGLHTYLEIIHILDCSTYCLTDYFVREKSKKTKKEHIIPHMVREDTVPYIPTEKASDFKEKYLFITKEWPIKAVISSAYENPHFWMYTLKSGFPESYLLLFETIINSQLIKFYYEIKNYVREGIPVGKEHLDQLPVPDLEEGWGTKELVEKFVKSVEMGTSHWDLSQTNNKNTFVLDLYDIYTYDIRKIEHYYMDKNRHVTEKDMQKYCAEVIDSLHPFVRNGFHLIAEWATSEFFGTIVKFSASKDNNPFQYNKDLEQFIQIIEAHENVERKDIFKEKKIRFYGDNCIYIYKSNKLKDWTEFMAILDGNKELHLIFLNPEE